MDVLVTGGTGFIGSRVCQQLQTLGHSVTALSRSPDEPPADGVDLVAGDVTDPESLDSAFDGQDAIIQLVALSPLRQPRGGSQQHDIVHRGGTENAVAVAESAGVDRFVQISGIHADPHGPTSYLRSKGHAEAIVRDSSLDHVILRPTVAFGDGGEFIPFIKTVAPPYITPLPGGGNTRFQLIWVEDIAEIIAQAATDDAHLNETYEVGGPDQLTLANIAKWIHRADGRSATVIPIPMALAGIGMTVGDVIPGFPFGRDQYKSLKLDLVTGENAIEEFGKTVDDLRPFDDYLGLDDGS